MANKTMPVLVLASSFLMSLNSFAGFDCQPAQNLKDFKTNPQQFMDQTPQKFNPANCQAGTQVQFWTQQEIQNKDFVAKKDQYRQNFEMETAQGGVISLQSSAGKAGIDANDRFEELVDDRNNLLRTLEEMEQQGLTEGKVDTMPWSDDYWAIARGVLGHRYADQLFVDKKDNVYNHGNEDHIWKELAEFVFEPINMSSPNYNYKAGEAPHEKWNASNQGENLSPSEKYDLLIGDRNYSLTKQSWNEGYPYYKQYNKVENWMGICHGWAPAAYMLPRPVKSVVVKSTDGKEIKFRPSDIKALGSLLWAKTRNSTRFIGGRCNDKDPDKDPNSGRVKSQDCFDNNPGSWHMSVVNQVGKSKLSVVMDATFDYEVWNHPIVSYSYRYFNPEKMEYANDLASAKVKKANFTSDKFTEYRKNKRGHYNKIDSYVGVVMEVKYAVETHPTTLDTDNVQRDGHNVVHYTYDLELDKNGKIIGGEWYSNKHPDFLWTPPVGTKAYTALEKNRRYRRTIENFSWDPASENFPQGLFPYAEYASGKEASPLGKVVRDLFNYAK